MAESTDLRADMPQFGKRTLLTEDFAEFEATFSNDPLRRLPAWRGARTPAKPSLPPLHARRDCRTQQQYGRLLAQGQERHRQRRIARASSARARGGSDGFDGAIEELRAILEELGEGCREDLRRE